MDERNEEKLEGKKEQRKIIESYDGDPDDLVFFQTEQDFAEQAKQKQAESIWGKEEESVQPEGNPGQQAGMPDGQTVAGGIPGSQIAVGGITDSPVTGGEMPGSQTVIGGIADSQMAVGEMSGGQIAAGGIADSPITGGGIPDSQAVIGGIPDSQAVTGEIPENRGIDPNDPHYVNYEPDPYYEYGYGEEPEPIGMPGGKKGDGTGLGIASMVTGICSIVFGCCGLQYVLSLTAIILGICGLTRKNKPQNAKVFSIIGIVLGALTLAVSVFGIIFSFGYPLIFQYFGYTP